jgi:hypothetical protein
VNIILYFSFETAAPALSAVHKATEVFAVLTVLEGLKGSTLISENYIGLFIGSSKSFNQHCCSA